MNMGVTWHCRAYNMRMRRLLLTSESCVCCTSQLRQSTCYGISTQQQGGSEEGTTKGIAQMPAWQRGR